MSVVRGHARFLALAVLVACAIGTPAGAQQRELKVVVTSKPIHSLVAQVMSGAGKPALLVEGPASPHTYAMRPSDAQKVSRADVLFRVSETLEPFTAKVVRALPQTVKVSTLAEAGGVNLLTRRAGGAFEAHKHGGGHGHGHKHARSTADAYDAHVWLDPDNAKAMTGAIAATLAERAPHSAVLFHRNAEEVRRRIDLIASDVAALLAPVSGRPFVVLHDAYQYFERRFGLNAIGSILVDPDEQPSARRLSDLRAKVARLAAVCVFAEPGHLPRIVSSVTEGSSARTAVLDPEGTLLEPGPDLYAKLMHQLADAMKGCLATPA